MNTRFSSSALHYFATDDMVVDNVGSEPFIRYEGHYENREWRVPAESLAEGIAKGDIVLRQEKKWLYIDTVGETATYPSIPAK